MSESLDPIEPVVSENYLNGEIDVDKVKGIFNSEFEAILKPSPCYLA